MAKSFIHTLAKNGAEYAYIYTPRKVNGKKDNDPVYLGRVVDKEWGIFRSRARGTFTYSLENGYGDVPAEAHYSTLDIAAMDEKLILDFGDAYLLYEALKTHNLYEIIYRIIPEKADCEYPKNF